MGSVVPKGSVAVIAPEPAALIVVGDVFAFRPLPDRRGNMMGRVVDIRRTEDGFFFQTADVSTDVPHRLLASEEDVIGTYRLHDPHVGAVVEAI